MASYHFAAKVVSMGKGQSAVHTAAYNNRCQLHDERHDRDTKDYDYKGKTEFSGIFAPKDAPAWVHDREQLWNRAEAAERQANGQPARNVEFALPHELNPLQRLRLVTDFSREAFARAGMIADVNIHEPHKGNDSRNYHVHCLLTMRRLDGDNFAKTKEREWNKTEQLEQWRDKWAQMGARALERAGYQQEADRFRHGHKSLAWQREKALARGDHEWAEHCDKEPQIHKGVAVSAMERQQDTRLADNEIAREAAAIDNRNAARAEIRNTEKALAAAMREAEQQRQPEPEKVQAKDERWQRREMTGMEREISAIHDIAAFQDGRPFRDMLYAEGILLARVDEKGIAMKDNDYQRDFQNELLAGNKDAELRTSKVEEGELVAVTKSGHVFRLNPNFVDRDALERAFQSSQVQTPTLSESLQHFADAQQQQREDRHARQHMLYDTREGIRQQNSVAFGITQTGKNAASDIMNAGLKGLDGAGKIASLGSFLESFLSMGIKRPPMTAQQQQQRAIEALERIEESIERGDRLSPSDVASLLPTQLDNLKRHGDAYMQEMISDLERYRKDRERQNDRTLER